MTPERCRAGWTRSSGVSSIMAAGAILIVTIVPHPGPAQDTAALDRPASVARFVGDAAPSTPRPSTATPVLTAAATATPSATATATVGAATVPATPNAAVAATRPLGGWRIRSVDTMKLSRDTLKAPLNDRQIAAVVRLDARLHLTNVTADVYYDAPDYMMRWVSAIRAAGLHVWFRAHWYAWENHRVSVVVRGRTRLATVAGSMTPQAYIGATRLFLRQHTALFRNGDIFDFCPEPENGAYWLKKYGKGWSWHSNEAAKHAFNMFIRSGVRMAATTLANRGLGGVVVTAISVDSSIALRLLSAPTVTRLGMITLDLYPERRTSDPAVATSRLVSEIKSVHDRWGVPVLVGEHGYPRDKYVDDVTQARVLRAELAGVARLPYVLGLNYWVDAGGPGYGGYTNLYRLVNGAWTIRPAAQILARAYAAATPP